MSRYTDQHITAGIGRGDHETLKYVYEHFFVQVRKFVLGNSGTEDDARDIFQEALVDIFEKLREGKLVLRCSFSTYLYAVSRHLWLKELRAKRVHAAVHEDMASYQGQGMEDAFTAEQLRSQAYKLVMRHFMRLGKECMDLLHYFAEGLTFREIAGRMGYSSDVHARKRKLRCREILLSSIRRDPDYAEFFEEET